MTVTAATWSIEEFANINLGDERLNKRMTSIVQHCADRPTASFPKTFNSNAEVVGAYRFFDNEKVTPEKILEPHWGCSEQRARNYPVVLAIQDTTELNFNGQQIAGLGSLTYAQQRGMYLHATLLSSTERESLGLVDAWMWAREAKDASPTAKNAKEEKTSRKTGKKQARAATAQSDADAAKIMAKESTRWVEGYERVADMAERLADTTRVVYV